MRRLALLVVLLAAGCGGAAEVETVEEGLTPEEYVAELDRICADLEERRQEIGEPDTPGEVSEQGPQLQDALGDALEEARGLGEPPDEVAVDANRFLALGDQLHAGLGELVGAVEEGDLLRAQELGEELEQLEQDSDAAAGELGAERCASGEN